MRIYPLIRKELRVFISLLHPVELLVIFIYTQLDLLELVFATKSLLLPSIPNPEGDQYSESDSVWTSHHRSAPVSRELESSQFFSRTTFYKICIYFKTLSSCFRLRIHLNKNPEEHPLRLRALLITFLMLITVLLILSLIIYLFSFLNQ